MTLEGQTIKTVRPMTRSELKHEGWLEHPGRLHGAKPVAIELENGTILYPSIDPEGNRPGVIFGYDGNHHFQLDP